MTEEYFFYSIYINTLIYKEFKMDLVQKMWWMILFFTGKILSSSNDKFITISLNKNPNMASSSRESMIMEGF